MGNPFDQFDSPTGKEDSGANPFDKFDHSEYVPTYSGIARNTIAGTNEGIAKVAGAPVDAMTWAVNKGIRGVNSVAGRPVANEIQHPFGGSESIKQGIGAIGGDNPDTIEARTPAERVFRAGGEGMGEMVTGAGEIGLLHKGLSAVAPRVYSVMEGLFGKPSIENAAIGASSGAGGQAAAEVAPEGYKPAAQTAGGLAGGMVPLGARVVYEGGKFIVNAGRDMARPFTKAGQEGLAGQQIERAASNPYSVRTALENGPQELVPGSKPTTFQQTGDMGLGQLERKVRTENPEDFIQRAAEQNAARRGAIQGVQATGSPADVATHFRGMRDSLDRVTEDAVNQARQRANQASAATGGSGNPEMYGAAMREPAANARAAAKEAENTLWKAVDPDGNLVMPATPIANVARNLEGQLSRSAKPLSGEERDIFDVAKGYGDQTAFKEVRDLRGRISGAMSEELRNNGRTPVFARLTQLRGAVERTIDRAVENQARIEQIAVKRGTMSEEDTMAARFQRHADEYLARRNSEQANNSVSVGAVGSGRSVAVPGNLRAAGQAGREVGLAPGDQGVPGVPIDPAAAQRLRAASDATRQRASTFDGGATGAVLKPGARATEYRTPDSLVPAKVFHPGPNGGESVRSYVNAVGEQQAHPAIADYAAFSLRKAALRPDGTMDPAKALAWAKQHDAALAELPPAIRNRLANPGRAQEAVEAAAVARKDKLDTFDRSEIAKVMSADSGDVVRQVGSVFGSRDGAARMAQLAMAAKGNPSAEAGLRRAIVEHIQSQFLSNAEAGTTGASTIKADAFQTFMRTKQDVLAKVFTPEEIGALRAVSTDLQRANRTINATKLPGGSNTAQDTLHRSAADGSILNRLVIEAAAATAGHAVTNSVGGGFAAWLGTKVGASLRDAGLTHVDELVKEAMLNPELARALLKKVPPKAQGGEIERIVNAARRISVAGPVIGATQQ